MAVGLLIVGAKAVVGIGTVIFGQNFFLARLARFQEISGDPSAKPVKLGRGDRLPSSRNSKKQNQFARVDDFAASVPNDAAQSVAALSRYLEQAPDGTAVAKARAAFFWVAKNIKYDLAFMTETEPEMVLKRRRGVCAGYAQLYTALCRGMRLECETVDGQASPAVAGRFQTNSNHAWNAVKIDGSWKLLDVTWASREDGEVEDYFFLVPPQEFIYTHFPSGEHWQFLDKESWKLEKFLALPKVQPAFFEFGLRLSSHTQSDIRAASEVNIAFELSSEHRDVRLSPVVFSHDVRLPEDAQKRFVKSNGKVPDTDRWEIKLDLSGELDQELKLIIFATAGPLNQSEKMPEVVSYRLLR